MILVTGASGFIGGRIVERLAYEDKVPVRALVRTPASAAWLARYSIATKIGVLEDPETLSTALSGCEAIVNCAASGSGNYGAAYQVNVQGVENLIKAAQAAGVKRIVHFSTLAVHGNRLPPRINENAAYAPGAGAYGLTKMLGELRAVQLCRDCGIDLIVLRPGLVYGPRSTAWSTAPYLWAASGRSYLIDHGMGIANLIYIDNLVDLVRLALSTPKQNLGAFHAVDGEQVTWRRFWQEMAKALPDCRMRDHRRLAAQIANSVVNTAAALRHRSRAYADRGRLGLGLATAMSMLARGTETINYVHGYPLDLFLNKTRVVPEKARVELGFIPRIDFAEGMEITREWLAQQHFYIPGRS